MKTFEARFGERLCVVEVRGVGGRGPSFDAIPYVVDEATETRQNVVRDDGKRALFTHGTEEDALREALAFLERTLGPADGPPRPV